MLLVSTASAFGYVGAVSIHDTRPNGTSCHPDAHVPRCRCRHPPMSLPPGSTLPDQPHLWAQGRLQLGASSVSSSMVISVPSRPFWIRSPVCLNTGPAGCPSPGQSLRVPFSRNLISIRCPSTLFPACSCPWCFPTLGQ